MAPKSTAGRCKKYHQKHKEVYQEKYALRNKKLSPKNESSSTC